MIKHTEHILRSVYGIKALSFHSLSPGWSAAAWRVETGSGDYFLKAYDKGKPSTKSWIDRIDRYMPVVLWLYEHTGLRDRMTAPLLTKDGSYKWEDADTLYMVFPFITGQTIADGKLNPGQVREIAEITAELHAHGAGIPVNTDGLGETFDVSFCDALRGWLGTTGNDGLEAALAPAGDTLDRAMRILESTAAALQEAGLRYVLCHTDIHGWNLMQSDRLILIDWEGLRLAPAEADLFSFTGTFFFEDAWEGFMAAYRVVRGDYRVNPAAMRFYRLRRRLEDIHAFAQSLLYDSLSPEDRDLSLYHLKRECGLLHSMADMNEGGIRFAESA